jgi:acyl carrier protein
MTQVTADAIRVFLLSRYENNISIKGFRPENIPDTFDLLTEGIVDSLGILEMITSIEEKFGFEIDFEGLDAEDITILGPLCRYIESISKVAND